MAGTQSFFRHFYAKEVVTVKKLGYNIKLAEVNRVKYKAIFFDRDGTLTYFNKEKETWRDQTVCSWSGESFELTYEKMMGLFQLASDGRTPWYKTVDDEKAFFYASTGIC